MNFISPSVKQNQYHRHQSINKLLFNWKKFEEKERTIAKANNSSLKESFNYLHHCILLGLS